MRRYRLAPSIVERDGAYHVRVAASLESTLSGMIALERRCDSRTTAEQVLAMLIDRVRRAVKAIGAAFDHGSGDTPR
jgi:hypothetical protein